MKKFVVTIHETRAYDFIVEAESPEAAREQFESGEFNMDQANDSRGLDTEVTNVEPLSA